MLYSSSDNELNFVFSEKYSTHDVESNDKINVHTNERTIDQAQVRNAHSHTGTPPNT